MKVKIYIAFMLGLIVIGTLCGCGIATNGTESSFEDVAYSLKKAEMSTGIPEFVILGWY